ncbi:MAG: secondary thiamine-phosphate synthase enzyme YjbQ [Corynebacterium sp.]|uniref:secondary thiamine-phosphate synthase enzyme YjbQ n=1 Tax=Corynebacterium sp. TaxID=1720 RepID=UPI0026E0FAC7|nr:secondary thiamine-phosphate synthase enzyme YjbQ [Corynebacterium sp.]MDO5670187.1 secondary thiamine-phosphate synthase enzyme YjbQ [Corynebacterium sp.]
MTGEWHEFEVETKPEEGFANPVYFFDITRNLQASVEGRNDGLLHVFVPHTTCTLIMNSGFDGTTLHDIRCFIENQVPTSGPFVHLHDGPQDAAAHVRSLFGVNSLTLPVRSGKLAISESQGVYLLELDGPRKRTVMVAEASF